MTINPAPPVRHKKKYPHQPHREFNLFFDLQRGCLSFIFAVKNVFWFFLGLINGESFSYQWAGAVLRKYFEEMGMPYQKLGQYLAIRFDLLPIPICEELAKLFEGVPPLDFKVVRCQVESELGGDLDHFYAKFSTKPLAAASIAQVHEAWGMNGEHYAVKIQRPGIEKLFFSDLRNMRRIARLLDWAGFIINLPLTETIDEFSRFTANEMDFKTEGQTADRLRLNDPDLAKIPIVYWSLSTHRILTMEFIEGISLSKLCEVLDAGQETAVQKLLPGINIEQTLNRLSHTMLTQLYLRGFFHADPHPGNILICPDGQIALVDFGIFGELNPFQRNILGKYVEALTVGDIEKAYDLYAKLLYVGPDTDVVAFRKEVIAMLTDWVNANLDPNASILRKHVGKVADDLLRVLNRYKVHLDLNTLLFWRALIVLDGTALRVGRHYDLMKAMRAFFTANQPNLCMRIQKNIANPAWLTESIGVVTGWPGALVQIVEPHNLHLNIVAGASAGEQALKKRMTLIAVLLLVVISTLILFGFHRDLPTWMIMLIGLPVAILIKIFSSWEPRKKIS